MTKKSRNEGFKISATRILEQFRASSNEVYTFDASLSKGHRVVVHRLALKLGLSSKSSGRGKGRKLSVYKKKRTFGISKAFGSLPHFTFSEESQQVLGNLFAHYPPGDGNLGETIADNSHFTEKTKQKNDGIFARPYMTKSEIARKREFLASRITTSPKLKQITEDRSRLPIASFKDVITSTVESHQVVLISGETGCGKTTQVPQYILDHMWGKGEVCKIVCTQPRRISATSVSERISGERGEAIGDSVGYKIRLESRGGRQSSIVLCTTGVLLRVLVSQGSRQSKMGSKKDDVSDITHIIMDEIHERDRYSDFMLAVIRDMLPLHPHLRLILMSATIDSERFSQYFGGCPIIQVPGFTYPVKTFYLEDVLSIVHSRDDNLLDNTTLSIPKDNRELSEEDKLSIDEAISLAWSSDEWDLLLELVSSDGSPEIINYQHSLTGLTPLMLFAGKGRLGDMCMLLSFGADCHLRAKDGTTAVEIAERENQPEAVEVLKKHMDSTFSTSMEEKKILNKYLDAVNPELVDVVLIEQLMRKICIDSQDGGILVFLSGWDDINKTRERLLASSFFSNTSKFIIISLHSMVPSMEQKKVFKRPPHGCRKIVLSTNIAESAITIDDIVYVIDTGRMKEKSYDPYSNMSTLQSSWVSKASAKQREGRAGRCQPGFCYHLYSKTRAASLPDFQIPEIRRMPIEELCLQVKMIDPSCKIEKFLTKTLDPPVFESIRNAIVVLQDIGALSIDEKLTELGEKIGSLPVHPLTSRMLFFAILMNCLDPALTLACASDYRDPFTLPMLPDDKKRATAARSELASLYGGCGDQFAVIAAYECWSNARKMGLEARFCSQYFVSSSCMNMISGMRKQLEAELIRNGFVGEDVSSYSVNAFDPGVLHSVLVAGLYPMVGKLHLPDKVGTNLHFKGGKRVMIETAGGDKVRLNNHSTNFKLAFRESLDPILIVFDEITRGDMGVNIRNCTVVGPLPLLLLSTEIAVAPAKENDAVALVKVKDVVAPSKENVEVEDEDDDEDDEGGEDEDEDEDEKVDEMEIDRKSGGQCEDRFMSSPGNMVRMIMDRWLYFGSTAIDVAQLYCLRERLSSAILYKVTHPRSALPPVLGASMHALTCVLSRDGCLGMPVVSDTVDTLTTLVNAANLGKPAAQLKGNSKKSKGKKKKKGPSAEVKNQGGPASGSSSKASVSAC